MGLTAGRAHRPARWPWIVTLGAAVPVALTWPRPIRLGGRWRVVAQAVAPWAALATAPIAGLAAVRRRGLLAAVATPVALGGVALARTVAGRPVTTARPPGPAALRVAHTNLLFLNEEVADVARVLADLDADVIGFSEYTGEHAATLRASRLACRYPYRIERVAPRASGGALWSRVPITEVPAPDLVHRCCAADIELPGGGVLRVLTVHTISPFHHATEWMRDLEVLADPAWRPTTPSVMVGDFNAAWTHPELLDVVANGWRSAHRDVGRGMVGSWRTDGHHVPFVRIDHAFVSDGVDTVSVEDVDVPGSDHRAFVVGVSPTDGGRARPAAAP